MLQAILYEIERLPSAAAASVDGMKEMLIEIGSDAHNEFTDNPVNAPGRPAMDDEREQFIDYIRSLSPRKLASVKPLSADADRALDGSSVEAPSLIQGEVNAIE